jgi:hypothetical protein
VITRGRVAAAAVVGVAAVSGLLLLAVARGWWSGDGGTYVPKRMLAYATVTPKRSLFGQVLTATVRVTVDPRRVDPSTIEVQPDFRPFSVRSEHDARSRIGRARIVSFLYELQCTSSACLPRAQTGRARGTATSFTLRQARIRARAPGGAALRRTVSWPAFGIQSRLTAQDVAFGVPVSEHPLVAPPVTWRAAPNLLAGLALALALLLGAAATAIVASAVLADGRPLRVLRIPSNLSRVERALRLAEHASRRGETDESRKALERLAAELRRRRAEPEADQAERLAWSASGPTEERVAELAQTVRSNGAR